MTSLDDAVRELEWVEATADTYAAHSVIGTHFVWHDRKPLGMQWRWKHNESNARGQADTLEAAQLAARQHFLSAVEGCLKEGYRVVKEGSR